MLLHDSLLPEVDSIEYLFRVASDHSPAKLCIWLPNKTPRTNPFWLKIPPPAPYFFLNKWQNFFKDNEGSAKPELIWDSFKAYVRGVMTLTINDLKWGFAHRELQLAEDALEAVLQYIKNFSGPNKVGWLCKDCLLAHLQSPKKAFFTRRSDYKTRRKVW